MNWNRETNKDLAAQVQARILSKTQKGVGHGPTSKTYEGKQTNKRTKDEDKGQKHEGEKNQIIKKRQTRRQKEKKQNQYDTAAYVFTFLRIPSGTTFCSETQVLVRRQIPERRAITCKVHQSHGKSHYAQREDGKRDSDLLGSRIGWARPGAIPLPW